MTRPEDTFSREIIAQQKAGTETEIEVVDLTIPQPDYKALLEKIFTADSVETW
ncbi:MAG TPA: hypothetical protein VH595_09615 [Verrucomicrobiae bacterium]|nr:hypothetical protein [Verrucomicrobiae bacterium]